MKISVKLIRFYQKFISPLSCNKCRFYPTCSEYAIWSFSHKNFLFAFFDSFFRILRCNPFFRGGIDYPKFKKKKQNIVFCKNEKIRPKFWFVPSDDEKFYIIRTII